MRQLFSVSSSIAASTLVVLLFAATALAQDEDPFGSSKSNQNPFGGSPTKNLVNPQRNSKVDPFRSESTKNGTETIVRANEIRRARDKAAIEERLAQLMQQNATLRDELDQQKVAATARQRSLANAALQSKAAVKSLQSKIQSLEAEFAVEKATDQQASQTYTRFLAQLLASEESSIQLIALAQIKQVAFESAEKNLPNIAANNMAISQQLRKLVLVKDETVQRQAEVVLLMVENSTAVAMGFQRSAFWRPTASNSPENEKIRRAFEQMIDFDYDESPVKEVGEDIEQQFDFNFRIHQSVDPDSLVTFSSRGQRLASSLDLLADQLKLVVCVREDSVELLPKDHADARSTLTYNVRGLLDHNSKVTLESLANLLNENLGEGSKVTHIGKYSLVAKAMEKEQRKISRVLGSLSTQE